jgi:hypothetical protein
VSIRDVFGDLDFSKVHLKANAYGSWMNVLVCDADRMDKVRAACQVLMKHSIRRLKFKFLDANGGEIEEMK